MAQVQSQAAGSHGMRPTTPPKQTPLRIPRLSPSRMPDQLLTSSYKNGHMNLDTFSPVNQNGSFEFDRVLRSGKVQRRTKKKGAWKPSWKAAYLVLRPNLLSIYKNADETELHASITLTDVTAVARVKKTNTDNVFGVFTPAKNYHFSGMDERDTSDWVTHLRIESRLEDNEEYGLQAPEFPPGQHNVGSDTTDLSAEDDFDQPGSPEGPHWSIRGNKPRVGSTSQRKPSGLRDYSGNETFTTSQSDLSDANPPASIVAGPPPSSSFNRSKRNLTPIPDNALPASRPSFQRSASQLSITQTQSQTHLLQQQAPALEKDPNRVIRQAHLTLIKSSSTVRQSKSVWAVLRPSTFSLYKSSSEYEPLKIFSVSDLIDAVEIDPVSKSKPFCFQVIGMEKTLRFCVEFEGELDGWLGALKSVINAKRSRSRGTSTVGGGILNAGATVGGSMTDVTGGTGPAAGLAHNILASSTNNAVAQSQSQSQGPIVPPGSRKTSQQLSRTGSELGGIIEGLENVNVNASTGSNTNSNSVGVGS